MGLISWQLVHFLLAGMLLVVSMIGCFLLPIFPGGVTYTSVNRFGEEMFPRSKLFPLNRILPDHPQP